VAGLPAHAAHMVRRPDRRGRKIAHECQPSTALQLAPRRERLADAAPCLRKAPHHGLRQLQHQKRYHEGQAGLELCAASAGFCREG